MSYLDAVPEPNFDRLAAIEGHSAGFAAAADGNLKAKVAGCPGWTVGDLVRHLTEVHWFWTTVVEEQQPAPPDESRRPADASEDHLIEVFRAGAARLVSVLRLADPKARCWTWAPAQQDVAFVVRHQVQEAAVHHWDAAHAAGRQLVIDPEVAADAVDEFLTFSVSSPADPADPPRPALEGRLALICSDIDAAWTVEDGEVQGTVVHSRGAPAATPAMVARASDLLLWLYRRVELDTGAVDGALAERLRALCFTG